MPKWRKKVCWYAGMLVASSRYAGIRYAGIRYDSNANNGLNVFFMFFAPNVETQCIASLRWTHKIHFRYRFCPM